MAEPAARAPPARAQSLLFPAAASMAHEEVNTKGLVTSWGKGPKIYKGSSRDTPWNRDLLWKLHVEHEAKGARGLRL